MMEPITTGKNVRYRAILAKAEEVRERKSDSNAHVSNWYDVEPPMSEVIKAAKEKGCDLIQIEIVTVETKVFEVK